jgi:DNA repair protein RadC
MSRSSTYMPQAYRAAQATHVRAATPLNAGENAQLLAALRANQQLLRDLMLRYDAGRAPVATLRKRTVAPTIRSPQDVWDLFGEEMSGLVQEQLQVLLLDTKHRLMR